MQNNGRSTRYSMKIYLVDGTYELFRSHFGVPPHKAPDGREVGATLGLLRSLLKLLTTPGITHVACAFDHVIESFRNDLWPGYKTGEGVDPLLKSQFELLEDALEAMGVGTPVLSTARGGTAEFVRDGENALVFAAGEEQALAARLRTLAEDEALRARLREGGLCTARQYTMTRFAQRTVEAMLAGDGATRAGHAATAGERRAAHAVA